MRQIFPVELPFIPGGDFSIVTDPVGEGILYFRVGNHLYDYPATGGSYAEFTAIAADEVALKPKGINHDEGASLRIVGQTA